MADIFKVIGADMNAPIRREVNRDEPLMDTPKSVNEYAISYDAKIAGNNLRIWRVPTSIVIVEIYMIVREIENITTVPQVSIGTGPLGKTEIMPVTPLIGLDTKSAPCVYKIAASGLRDILLEGTNVNFNIEVAAVGDKCVISPTFTGFGLEL